MKPMNRSAAHKPELLSRLNHQLIEVADEHHSAVFLGKTLMIWRLTIVFRILLARPSRPAGPRVSFP